MLLENILNGWSQTVRGGVDAFVDVDPGTEPSATWDRRLFCGVAGVGEPPKILFEIEAVAAAGNVPDDIDFGVPGTSVFDNLETGSHGSVIIPESTVGILGTGGASLSRRVAGRMPGVPG